MKKTDLIRFLLAENASITARFNETIETLLKDRITDELGVEEVKHLSESLIYIGEEMKKIVGR